MIAMVLTGDEKSIWAFLGSLKNACRCSIQTAHRCKGMWAIYITHENEEILVENIEKLIQQENISTTITLGYTQRKAL